MTVQEILEELEDVKPISRPRLYVYLRRFKIKPLARRVRPQHYPADTPRRIISRLGLSQLNGNRKRH